MGARLLELNCDGDPVTLLYYNPICLEHDTGDHPERASRILGAARFLQEAVQHLGCQFASWPPISASRLERVHTAAYLETVREFAAKGGGYLDPDTVVCPRSFEIAQVGAGAVADAVQRVVGGKAQQAFCLIRPPGHHALADTAMGFCLLNNVAVGARVAIDELGLDRVLIVDWDVHHGNGTQAIFWEDPQVGFYSIHRYPFYPGTGAADEIGEGAGRGATRNVPIEFGTSRADYLRQFRESVEEFAARIRPQLVLISAGFDAHRDDPIGSLGLESEDFATLTDVVLHIADEYASGRVVSVMEGGYNPRAVAESVEAHLQHMIAWPPSR